VRDVHGRYSNTSDGVEPGRRRAGYRATRSVSGASGGLLQPALQARPAAARSTFVEHRLQPVAVGVANERRVVAGIVVHANAGRTFVDTPFVQGLRMETIDRLAARGNEGDVEAWTGRLRVGTGRDDGEGRLGLVSRRPVPHAASVLPEPDMTERCQT